YTQTRTPAGKIITTTILCFSLAGLFLGFAAGGFLGRAPHPTGSITPKQSPVVHSTPSPAVTVSPTVENVLLDNSNVTHISTSEIADGATSYTFSAQPIYKGTNKPINVADVTCRLWLTSDLNGTYAAVGANNFALLHHIDGLSTPFPLETPAALNFTTGTQVQPCNANSNTTWTYTLSPTIQPGTYYLYILADWKGIHYNMTARGIQVTAQ
ncbi:MAG: hypothetical protein ACRDHW_17065, partial [Ktedonobacteraceae bacterium]